LLDFDEEGSLISGEEGRAVQAGDLPNFPIGDPTRSSEGAKLIESPTNKQRGGKGGRFYWEPRGL